jgi:competence protein ComEC
MLLPMLLAEPSRPAAGEFAVLAADIGQGNALLVQTAKHSLLYDTGPRFSRESDAGQRTLVPFLRALGEKLDVVMVSHRDADHIGGAAAVLKMQPQARLLSSIEAEHELQALRPAERCAAGRQWQWDGVRFEILHPSSADYDSASKPNAMSCVLRISNARQTVLLTGDLEAAQEQKLVAQGARLKADVMLVPHHGSKTSSTPEFLDAVSPRIALVQAGYRNRFQHPVTEVMQRYKERGIRVVASPACGAAVWKSDDSNRLDCQRDLAKRYWHHPMP